MNGLPTDPLFVAAIDLVGRSGATGLQIRWDDEQDPIVWVACAEYVNGAEAAGALDPLTAVMRLVQLLVRGERGALCAHCGKPAGLADDWMNAPPPSDTVCWFVFDPELVTFRRRCEGQTTGRAYGRDPQTGVTVGRNDPCPCGSGLKWKRCHGSGAG